MLLRLLASTPKPGSPPNTYAWLAEHVSAYLAEPNEHRAILRHLKIQGGHVHYMTITITLNGPDAAASPSPSSSRRGPQRHTIESARDRRP